MLVPEPTPPKIEITMKTQEVTCPFCLYTHYISKFYIRISHGKVSEKRFKCPDCGQVMMKKTLTQEMSTEEFAEWMLMMGQWDRVSFDKFRKRLKEMGISYQFWSAYKKAKETYTSESYEDHLKQEQKEDYDRYMADQRREE